MRRLSFGLAILFAAFAVEKPSAIAQGLPSAPGPASAPAGAAESVIDIQPSDAGQFTFNVPFQDVMARVDVALVKSLGIGESGGINVYTMCFDGDRLMISVSDSLVSSFWGTYAFVATRSENGFAVTVVPIEDNGLAPDRPLTAPILAKAVASMASVDSCKSDRTYPGESDLAPVDSVNGSRRMSDLLDQMSVVTETPAAAAEAPTENSWNLREEKDEITDQPNVYLRAESKDAVFTGFQSKTMPIIIRCQRNTTSVYVVHDDYEVDDAMKVSWRVDGGKSTTARWQGSSDRNAVGLWSGGQAIPFLQAIANGNEIVMRLEGRSDIYDLKYSLEGLKDHLLKVSQACNWTL